MQEPGKEDASYEKPFRVSDYKEGVFQPSGEFSREGYMGSDAIASWEEENLKFHQGKVWGAGQALFFRDKPLVFGRNTDQVDVQVCLDPNQDGSPMEELAVSRRHFELQPPLEGKIKIRDLGSTNGVSIYDRRGKLVADLNKDNPDGILEEGYFTLFGGGPTRHGRLIGFRVCKDTNDKLFLVKFNAHNLADLLAMIGVVRSDAESKGSSSPEERLSKLFESDKLAHRREEVVQAYEMLIGDIKEVRELKAEFPDSLDLLKAFQKLFDNIFRLSGDLGEKFYDGDWHTAAGLISILAMGEGKKHLSEGDQDSAALSADLSLLARNLFLNRLFTFTRTI